MPKILVDTVIENIAEAAFYTLGQSLGSSLPFLPQHELTKALVGHASGLAASYAAIKCLGSEEEALPKEGLTHSYFWKSSEVALVDHVSAPLLEQYIREPLSQLLAGQLLGAATFNRRALYQMATTTWSLVRFPLQQHSLSCDKKTRSNLFGVIKKSAVDSARKMKSLSVKNLLKVPVKTTVSTVLFKAKKIFTDRKVSSPSSSFTKTEHIRTFLLFLLEKGVDLVKEEMADRATTKALENLDEEAHLSSLLPQLLEMGGYPFDVVFGSLLEVMTLFSSDEEAVIALRTLQKQVEAKAESILLEEAEVAAEKLLVEKICQKYSMDANVITYKGVLESLLRLVPEAKREQAEEWIVSLDFPNKAERYFEEGIHILAEALIKEMESKELEVIGFKLCSSLDYKGLEKVTKLYLKGVFIVLFAKIQHGSEEVFSEKSESDLYCSVVEFVYKHFKPFRGMSDSLKKVSPGLEEKFRNVIKSALVHFLQEIESAERSSSSAPSKN